MKRKEKKEMVQNKMLSILRGLDIWDRMEGLRLVPQVYRTGS